MLTRNEQHHANASSMGSQDIVNLILDDHKSLKNLIRIMKDGTQPAEIRFLAFKEFVPKLIAHAKPEEQTLYLFMKAIGSVREDGFAGNLKKSIADQLVEEIKKTTDLGLRIACIKVLAEYVEHRIEEEEKDLLPDFVYYSKPSDRQNLGNSFLNKKKINLRKVMAAARADSL